MNEQLQARLAELDSDALDRLYMEVFNTETGKMVLEDMKNRCYYFTTTLDPDEKRMAFNEGQRALVMMIETRLRPIKAPPKEED